MDTGAAGHAMPAEMFPRVKVDRTTATKNCVAANGETSKTWVRKPYHSSPLKECTDAQKNQERERCEAFDLNEEGRASWQCQVYVLSNSPPQRGPTLCPSCLSLKTKTLAQLTLHSLHKSLRMSSSHAQWSSNRLTTRGWRDQLSAQLAPGHQNQRTARCCPSKRICCTMLTSEIRLPVASSSAATTNQFVKKSTCEEL